MAEWWRSTVFACILLLIATINACASVDKLPLPKGGEDQMAAEDIEIGEIYYTDETGLGKITHWIGERQFFVPLYCGYYKFVAKESGLHHCSLSAFYHISNPGLILAIYDKYGDVIAGSDFEISDNEKIILEVNLEIAEEYTCVIYYYNNETKVEFSICSPHNHVLPGEEYTTSKAATCVDDGIAIKSCEICEAEIDRKIIRATGHKPGDAVVISESTCIHKGNKAVKCMICDETLSVEEIPLIDHKIGIMTIVSPATCLDNGYAEQRCEVCNLLMNSEIIPVLGHKSSPWSVEVPANCTQEGEERQYCLQCSLMLNSKPIKALGHINGKWVTLREATCTAGGKRVLYCGRCNAVLQEQDITAFGHSVSDWEIEREASCLQSGLEVRICTVCGATIEREELPALGHEYTEWIVITAATKDMEGERQRHCIHCGDTQSAVIEKQPKLFGLF